MHCQAPVRGEDTASHVEGHASSSAGTANANIWTSHCWQLTATASPRPHCWCQRNSTAVYDHVYCLKLLWALWVVSYGSVRMSTEYNILIVVGCSGGQLTSVCTTAVPIRYYWLFRHIWIIGFTVQPDMNKIRIGNQLIVSLLVLQSCTDCWISL